jgi:hypothetical protein
MLTNISALERTRPPASPVQHDSYVAAPPTCSSAMPFLGFLLNSATPSCHFSLYARFLLRASPPPASPPAAAAAAGAPDLGVVLPSAADGPPSAELPPAHRRAAMHGQQEVFAVTVASQKTEAARGTGDVQLPYDVMLGTFNAAGSRCAVGMLKGSQLLAAYVAGAALSTMQLLRVSAAKGVSGRAYVAWYFLYEGSTCCMKAAGCIHRHTTDLTCCC